MAKKLFLCAILLFTTIAGAWAWDGSGTSSDPYLIKSSADWKQLADDVSGGNSFSGQFFEMAADIDAEGISVGAIDKPFSGSFNGCMYTLTYNRGEVKDGAMVFVSDYCAPFIRLDGATIRDLKVKGVVYSGYQFAAGIAVRIEGDAPTTISSCSVSSHLWASNDFSWSTDVCFGGLVGTVTPACTASPTISNCVFTGVLQGRCTGSSGMVGFANIPVNFEHCMFDPIPLVSAPECANYVRTSPGVECTFKECYYTTSIGTIQGEAVFREVTVPEGCTYRFVSKPQVPFNGVDYYTSGTVIELTAPDDMPFDHWETNTEGCWLSNPWQRSGLQTVRDINFQPSIRIETSPVNAHEELEMDGTKYRYLYRYNYHYYLSDETCREKGYHFDDKGELYKWSVDGDKVWLTAVVGWVPGDIPSDGAQIHNDLAGATRDHTHMACIAPQAFQGCTELKTLYFKDTDANNKPAATSFDFTIGDRAFAVCSNLTEVKMMQYTTTGTNQWKALIPAQISAIGENLFDGSSHANFTVDASQYQNFLSSQVWKPVNNRILIYNHTDVDMEVNGAKYSEMRNTQGNSLKNDAEGHDQLMETLRYWNADYQQFTASTLLTTIDENIWYTKVVGVDAGSLDKGTMRIYNDPGSYYNYKTIALESLGESKDVTSIEFWQTNGRSENSFTDLKMVIRNGALKGCDNLKEIRLFYYVQDGDNHWETLGPQDVIPSDDIFGIKTYDLEGEDIKKAFENRNNTQIIVSTNRYLEFMEDPNWQPYLDLLVPQDGPDTQVKDDFTKEGVTYGYMTNPGGIMQTSQTVSQDVSWWTLPRIAIEVALTAASIYEHWKNWKNSVASAEQIAEAQRQIDPIIENVKKGEAYVKPYTDRKEKMLELGNQLWKDGTISSRETATNYIKTFKGLGEIELQFDRAGEFGHSAEKFGRDFLGQFVNGPTEEYLEEALPKFTVDQLQEICKLYNSLQPDAIAYCNSFIDRGTLYVGNEINKLPEVLRSLLAEEPSSFEITQAYERHLQTLSALSHSITPGSLLPGTPFGIIGANTIMAQNHYGFGNYDAEGMRQGMRQNILSNMHQVGLVGGGYVITTPAKNLAYHTCIKDVPDQNTVTLYTGTDEGGLYANTTTAAIARDAFRGKRNVRIVQFHESEVTTNEAVPMALVIPDSIFAGTSVHTLDLRLQTNENGTQAMGPESFILAGIKTFDGVDTLRFHIIIDPSRKEDFLYNESWASYERYFTYESAKPNSRWGEYGGMYGLAYANGSVQKVHKASGHKIEHTLVTEPDDLFLSRHSGGLKLCNDIGIWNNYQLDAVIYKAVYGNKNVTTVNFTDLPDMPTGTSYTDLNVALRDSCFANSSLKYLEMVYLVTDGTNHLDAITPQQVKIGDGVLDGTRARIKMMPQQVAWFEADSSWVKYKDRFMPCIIQPADKGFKKVLKDAAYYDRAHTDGDADTWDKYADLSRIADQSFHWLDGKFTANKDDIYSLADFKHFASVGLTSIGQEMFKDLTKMTNIELPSTTENILFNAFENCSALQEIELPAKVKQIWDDAFKDCTALKTIVVRGTTPATLHANVFPRNEGMKIYVPAESLDAYLTAWAEYKDYIVSDAEYHINKVVKLDVAGTLADKLGLSVEWSYTGLIAGDEPYLIHGPYAKYDSLTVSGPLNDLDIWVIRYLGGCNS